MVIKKNGAREPFERSKLEKGINLACYRRPVRADMVQALIDDIETTLVEQEVREVPTAKIGDMVMTRLRELDEVAYIRFASVYRSFADLGKLREAVESLMDQPTSAH